MKTKKINKNFEGEKMEKQLVINEKDFRAYKPEIVSSSTRIIKMQLCEELVEGRWEPFYTIVK